MSGQTLINKIAIIPARGGSKRILQKNIKKFHGKPIIAYSIEAALQSRIFDSVVVSTDDEQIAKIALQYGAEVPFIRDNSLSDDFTTTKDVVDHALSYFASQGKLFDFSCVIYATAPFLDSKYLTHGYNALKNSTAINAFSVTSMPFPIQRSFAINDNGRCKMFTPEYFETRSQDLEEGYQDAGQFYWTRLGHRSDKCMFGEDSIPIILPRYLVQDIDTLADWKLAEMMYKVWQEMDK